MWGLLEDFKWECDIGKYLRKINLEVHVEPIMEETTGGSGWEMMRTWTRAVAFEIKIACEQYHSNRISLSSLICLFFYPFIYSAYFFIHLFIQLTNQQMFHWIPKICQGHGDTEYKSQCLVIKVLRDWMWLLSVNKSRVSKCWASVRERMMNPWEENIQLFPASLFALLYTVA